MHNIYQKDTHSKPDYVGKVEKIEKIESATMKGSLITAYIDGYGHTQPFYEAGEGVLLSEIDERRNYSGMPVSFMSKTGKDFDFNIYGEDTKFQKSLCNAYIKNFKSGIRGDNLYIYSNTPGSGKTKLACCLANEILKRYNISVKFINVSDFIELSFQAHKTEDDKEKIKAIKEATLLIFDDIGANNTKEAIDSTLFGLIDYRNRNNLTTIYTSNLNREELQKKLHDRVVSRVFDNTIPIPLPEVSVRDIQNKQNVEKRIKELLQDAEDDIDCFG